MAGKNITICYHANHMSSISIWIEGEFYAYGEEERFSRIKKDHNGFVLLIDMLRSMRGLVDEDDYYHVIYTGPVSPLERDQRTNDPEFKLFYRSGESAYMTFFDKAFAQVGFTPKFLKWEDIDGPEDKIGYITRHHNCIDAESITYGHHHLLHHYSAIERNPSGTNNVLTIVSDGSGSNRYGMVDTGKKGPPDKDGKAPSIIMNMPANEDMSIFFTPAEAKKGEILIFYKSVRTNFKNSKEYFIDNNLVAADGFTKYLEISAMDRDIEGFMLRMHNGFKPPLMFEKICKYMGFDQDDAGKVMGLAPYGEKDKSLPKIYDNKGGLNNFYFKPVQQEECIDPETGETLPEDYHTILLNIDQFPYPPQENPEWHKDFSKCPQFMKNLAYRVQKDSQDYHYKVIKNNIKLAAESGITVENVILTGGFSLNCTANYYIRKKLDEDYGFGKIGFFPDPLGYDGGTVMGGRRFINHEYTKTVPEDTLYLGLDYHYSIQDIEKTCGKHVITDTTFEEVAELIANKNIVTIFQGRSEAGPRALGNRSILYDPRDPNGKEHVNIVKRREWFRPFAGSVLHEHMHDYFDMASLDESPFMMYAVDVLPEKIEEIPAITHVDNTCRVQTVKRKQNENYYDLIEAFYKKTGTPILFNTSFNLAGEPLAETLYDAIRTMEKSDMEYMFLPEQMKLVYVKNEVV